MALSKEAPNEARLLRTRRTLPPNWSVWLPLTHERSSTKLWTGVVRSSVRRKPFGRKMKRKVTRVWSESPWSENAARVNPYAKRLTSAFEIVHEWPAAMPHGWFQMDSPGVSGKHWMLSGFVQSVAP